MKSLFKILFLFLFVSCIKDQESQPTLFELISSDHSGINFENRLTPTIANSIFEYEYYYNGGGVGVGDFNNDGLSDLFFAGNQVPSKLYLNKGDFKFEDITSTAGIFSDGWCTGVAIVDVNQDGWQDIYVSHAGLEPTSNQLFVNLGKQKDNSVKFKEQAKEFGLDYKGFTTQSVFFDFDKDGDLDVYLLNHHQATSNLNFPKNKVNDGSESSTDHLFRNDSDGSGRIKFTDISKQAGITMEGFGLGIAVCDLNLDGWEDLYITNDFVFDDLIYINNKNGTFTESGKSYLTHTSRFSMGCDIADFNNDSYQDIVVLDMLPEDNRRQKLMNPATNNDLFYYSLKQGYLPQYTRNMLQLNNGPNEKGNYSFSEIGQLAGIYKTDWSWSPLLVDLDNDGWKDLFISNGIPKDVTNHDFLKYKHVQNKQFQDPKSLKRELLERLNEMESIDKPNVAYKNNKDLTFTDVSKTWGLDKKGFSNGTVYADLDNDGDLDLVTNNINAKPFVLKNNTTEALKNNFLKIKVVGKFSSGARVKITSKGNQQYYYTHLQRGFQSSQENIVHFGIGKENTVDTLEVIWADGKTHSIFNISANQTLTLDYDIAATTTTDFSFGKNNINVKRIFSEVDRPGIKYSHKENNVEDFNFESLLPHRFSTNGPFTTVGDINSNGLDDLWVGGAAGFPGKIFMQFADRRFTEFQLPDPEFEDMGGLMLDVDKDGDLDLYVVSGGNEYNQVENIYQDRLYINDGKGNFVRGKDAVPIENISGSCVVGGDFDKDGDIDLFVGGRLLTGKYPFPSESFILRNDGNGKFQNVTKQICPSLKNIGLVTSAIWTDFDGDGELDLVVAGEWMAVEFFKNVKGKFERLAATGVEKEKGWWFSLSSGDYDQDGDIDFVCGNLGLNSKLKASHEYPVSVYAKDFIGNGKTSSILTCHIQGREYPIANRDQIGEQIPFIRSRFKTYEDFGNATLADIFPEEELKDAIKLSATNFNSILIENKGNGKFEWKALPIEAQFSAVQSIITKDFDKDGNLDLLIGGNFFSPDFISGRYDASIGLYLKGNGKGNFKSTRLQLSGVDFGGDVRSLAPIEIAERNIIIVAPNQGDFKFFEY